LKVRVKFIVIKNLKVSDVHVILMDSNSPAKRNAWFPILVLRQDFIRRHPMKNRRHHNNKGYRRIKRGKLKKDADRLNRRLVRERK